jgi:hypothetical protein
VWCRGHRRISQILGPPRPGGGGGRDLPLWFSGQLPRDNGGQLRAYFLMCILPALGVGTALGVYYASGCPAPHLLSHCLVVTGAEPQCSARRDHKNQQQLISYTPGYSCNQLTNSVPGWRWHQWHGCNSCCRRWHAVWLLPDYLCSSAGDEETVGTRCCGLTGMQ